MTEKEWGDSAQYGYSWKNGLVGTSGYLLCGVDIDSAQSHTSLGKKLGNCSVTNKTLTLTVDGTTYNVVFNTDLTAASNATVLGLINAVIGSVATADEFYVAGEYYPEFAGNRKMANADSVAILAGYGVVFTSQTAMRNATNADGYIDGICLDTTGVGGKGRVITKGMIYAKNAAKRFSIAEASNASRAAGVGIGISATTAGLFDVAATPVLLRAVATNELKIL